MSNYNIHGVIISTDIKNEFLNKAFVKRYEKYMSQSRDIPLLKINELLEDELIMRTQDFTTESYKQNKNCMWMKEYEDIVIWIKDSSQIYFSITTKDDSMVAYIWLTRFLNFLLFEYYGLFHIHSSCVTNNAAYNSASIFCGESGTGKSTIALNLVNYGGKIIAEDNLYAKILNDDVIALTNISEIKMRKNSYTNCDNFSYVSRYDDFFKKNVIELNENCFLDKEYSKPNKIYILNQQKSIFGSIKPLSKEKGLIYFLREYSTYSIFNSKKFIDFFYKLCSQCDLYLLTPSNNVKKTIQLIQKIGE